MGTGAPMEVGPKELLVMGEVSEEIPRSNAFRQDQVASIGSAHGPLYTTMTANRQSTGT